MIRMGPNSIGQRRITYACCAMGYMSKYLNGLKYGDKSCENNKRLWLYMQWAKSIADRTPLTENGDWNNDWNEDFNVYGFGQCVSHDFASQVFEKADCYCAQCGCPPEDETIVYPPPPDPCAITPTYSVIAVVDVDQRLIIEGNGPVLGDNYFVVTDSGGSGWTVNTIVTWNGSGWDAITPVNGEVVSAGGTGWVTYANDEPGLLFPAVTATLVNNPNGAYIIQSDDPQTALYSGRNVRLEILTPGGWIAIPQYQPFIPEVNIASPIPFDSAGTNFTQIRAAYVDGDCTYQGPTGTVVPPVGSCGTLVVDITPESDCGMNEFYITVDIQSAEGFPLGDLVATVNGGTPVAEPAVLGTTVLGPYATGDEVNIRIENSFDSECDYDAGTFSDPSQPIPTYTVNAAVDASFQGSATPGETYLIVSDNTSAGNTWASHVGEVTNIFLFTPLNEGEVVDVLSVPGFDRYWQRVGGLTVQMYPQVTVENTQLYPLPWTVISDNPTSAATRFQPAVVEGLFGATWYPIWAGLEFQLATLQTIDLSAFGAAPDDIRVNYFPTGGCPIVVGGNLINEDIDTEITCDAENYYQYDYADGATPTWTFTSPSGSVSILFTQGSMPPGVVLWIYDGPDNLSPVLLAGNYPGLIGVFATAPSGTMFIEVIGSPSGTITPITWIFGMSCTTGSVRPTAAATPLTDCDEYNFVIDVEVLDAGDSPGGLIDIQYKTVGSSVVNTIENVSIFSGIQTLGPFPYGTQVEIYLIHLSDPLANVFLGIFTDDGLCATDPCLPDIFQRAEYAGDYADIGAIVGTPVNGNTFFVLTNSGGPSPAPGDLMVYNGGTMEWQLLVSVPEGAYVFAGTVAGGSVFFEDTTYLQGNSGPINYFQPISVAPNRLSTGPSDAWTIAIINNANEGRNVLLDVLVNGSWVTVWTGTESDLVSPINIQIDDAFTLTRTTYNYDTCPVEVLYYITTNNGTVIS